ncbi:MAG: site-specific integrase [Candidatus Cloacimonetes bacterium]|nr:site-specific integrase [Candidatus Cloacimonadota bacterium]
MASIKKTKLKNGKSSYNVRVRLKGKTVFKTFRTMGEARNFIIETEQSLEAGKFTDKIGDMPVKNLFERYISQELPMRKRPKSYLAFFNFFSDKIGHLEIKDVSTTLLLQIRQKMIKEGRLSFASINRYFASVGRSFAMAVEWDLLEDNPFRKVGKLKEPKGRVRFLSDDERERLLFECKKVDYLYVVVVLALTTGARKGEIMTLTWRQVIFKENIIILEDTKNGERRSLPLCKFSKQVLLDWKAKEMHKTKVFHILQCQRSWQTAIKNAEITNFKFHDLRHSCASYLAMQGVPLLAIADILGHKSLDMVKRYAHLSNTYKSSIIETLGDFLFPNSD